MLTRCPICHARATLSGDHGGAKVRCADCGHVFVARPGEAEGPASRANPGLVLGGLLGLLFVIVLIVLVSRKGSDASAAQTPAGAAQHGHGDR
jgi:predicted Zn finger-like uncharacterized protein